MKIFLIIAAVAIAVFSCVAYYSHKNDKSSDDMYPLY